jgi:hypothetical protein
VDEVFTKKFLQDSGGKAEFVEKIKQLPKQDNKMIMQDGIELQKGNRNEVYFVQLKSAGQKKRGPKQPHSTQFIVVKEDGKFKIDGTLSDAD